MIIQVTTTVDSEEKADFIAEELLKGKVVSCVQIVPITSKYWWKGKIENTKEWILLMKGNNFEKIENEIKKMHPYEIPEILAVEIDRGNKEYIDWINKEVKK